MARLHHTQFKASLYLSIRETARCASYDWETSKSRIYKDLALCVEL